MLIGVAGQAQNGKDTVANIICKHIHLKPVAFANELKHLIQHLFNIDRDTLESYKVQNMNPPNMDVSMRKALQIIGDSIRQVKSTYWIDKLPFSDDIICTDIRYENELEIFKKKGGIIILVAKNVSESDVPSEKFLIPAIKLFLDNTTEKIVNVKNISSPFSLYDFFIRNDSTLSSLVFQIETSLIPSFQEVPQTPSRTAIMA